MIWTNYILSVILKKKIIFYPRKVLICVKVIIDNYAHVQRNCWFFSAPHLILTGNSRHSMKHHEKYSLSHGLCWIIVRERAYEWSRYFQIKFNVENSFKAFKFEMNWFPKIYRKQIIWSIFYGAFLYNIAYEEKQESK